MSVPEFQVVAYLGLGTGSGNYFVLDSSQLNGPRVLADDVAEPEDITAYCAELRITRGRRSRLTEDINPGVAVISLRNEARTFDPTYAAGMFFGSIEPGRRVDIRIGGFTAFSGRIDDWNYDYDVSGQSTAQLVVLDSLGQLAQGQFDAWTTTSQLPGARVSAVLDRSEVGFGPNRAIDAGQFTLQADNVSWGSNVLNYLQLVARSDFGYLFATRENTLTFRDRTEVAAGATSAATFTDAPSTAFDISYHGIATQYGSETLYGRVGVDREGGTNQTVTNATSVDTYGYRSLTLTGLLLNSDADSLVFAQYLSTQYGTPQFRVSSLTVKAHGFDAGGYAQYICATRDIADALDVTFTPNGVGDPINDRYLVEGIEHQIGPDQWTVTFHLGDIDTLALFILDDAWLGRLDHNALAF